VRLILIIVLACGVVGEIPLWAEATEPAQAESEETWVRGIVAGVPCPVWGVANGLQIGLAPLPGPRGLLRVYAPYLDQPVGQVINFIAVEPIPKGSRERGLSELEFSRLDSKQGKRFDSSNTPDEAQAAALPASGIIETIQGEQCLCVYIHIEPFDNGAYVYLKLMFRHSRPHEVAIATFAHNDSVPLEYCIVTATMGNYARLRRLQLAERTVTANELWPDYKGDDFAPHSKFALDQLARSDEGCAIATATTDEADPTTADYAEGTRRHWRYSGLLASQSWKSCSPDPELEVWVNGRTTYWASQHNIPGGMAFENFEMVAPFKSGQEFIFAVEPLPAAAP
jgi:hypothetical protein